MNLKGKNTDKLKLAAVHSYSLPLNIEANWTEMCRLLNRLEDQAVNFALFPELSLSGYINSLEMLKNYLPHHPSILDRLTKLSETIKLGFAIGLPMPLNKSWGIAQLIFYKGKLLHTHFKSHLSVHEKLTFEQANSIDNFDFMGHKIGIQLCLESHFPELSIIQQKKGAEILCFAYASPREDPQEKFNRLSPLLKTRAYDNACFVMACNLTGQTPSHKPYAGLALITSPRGQILSQSLAMESGFCTAQINFESIKTIKNSQMSNFTAYRNLNLKYSE